MQWQSCRTYAPPPPYGLNFLSPSIVSLILMQGVSDLYGSAFKFAASCDCSAALLSTMGAWFRWFNCSYARSLPLPPSVPLLILSRSSPRGSATPSRRPPIPLRTRASFQLFAFPGQPLESPLLYALSTWELRRFPAICDLTPRSAARRSSLIQFTLPREISFAIFGTRGTFLRRGRFRAMRSSERGRGRGQQERHARREFSVFSIYNFVPDNLYSIVAEEKGIFKT